MQFGKIHGLALIVLGAFLLCVQTVLFLAPKEVSSGASGTSTTKTERKTNPLAGILGVVILVGGIAILSTARRADEPAANHAVK